MGLVVAEEESSAEIESIPTAQSNEARKLDQMNVVELARECNL